MLQGVPSRNGATRTASQRGAKNPWASAACASSVTQRTNLPPPLKPSRASPDHTVPCPASTRAAAATSPSASPAATISHGDRATPARSNSASLVVLSSSATHAGGRAPTTGRADELGGRRDRQSGQHDPPTPEELPGRLGDPLDDVVHRGCGTRATDGRWLHVRTVARPAGGSHRVVSGWRDHLRRVDGGRPARARAGHAGAGRRPRTTGGGTSR